MKLLVLAACLLVTLAQCKGDDKTQVLSSSFSNHAQLLKDAFDDMFANRPTGRPDVKDFIKALEKKYKEAKENLKGLHPTGRPSEDEHKQFHDADRLLKDQFKDAKEKVEAWKKQVEADKHKDHDHKKKEPKGKGKKVEDKAAEIPSSFSNHAQLLKNAFDDMFANRPTGRPDVKDFMKALEKKYKEAKENLKGLHPTGRPSKEEHKQFHDADRLLKDQFKDAQEKVDAWKKQAKADKHKDHDYKKKGPKDKHSHDKSEDADETEVISSSFSNHVQLLKDVFDDMFANRPTGRPHAKDFMKALEKKYKEAKKNLKGLHPTGRPSEEEHKQFHDADRLLKDQFKDAREKVEAWKKQMNADKHEDHDHEDHDHEDDDHEDHDHKKKGRKDKHSHDKSEDADETEVISSSFSNHVQLLKDAFDDMFTNRPTGRPDVKDFMKALEKKYKDAKKNLKGLHPTGRPSEEEHKQFHDADRLLKDQFKDAREKVEAWKKQMNADKHKDHDHEDDDHEDHDHKKKGRKDKHSHDKSEDADETEVISSSFSDHVQLLKDAFVDMFANRPTGRPHAKDFMKALREKYNESRKNLKGLRPTGRPSDAHKQFRDSDRLLKDQFKDAKQKVDAWKKVNADKHKDHDHKKARKDKHSY